jgi:hypothetical protein
MGSLANVWYRKKILGLQDHQMDFIVLVRDLGFFKEKKIHRIFAQGWFRNEP